MEDWRLIAFAVFMIAILVIGLTFLQRRRHAQKTGNDPLYGVASLGPNEIDQAQSPPRTRGVGTTDE